MLRLREILEKAFSALVAGLAFLRPLRSPPRNHIAKQVQYMIKV